MSKTVIDIQILIKKVLETVKTLSISASNVLNVIETEIMVNYERSINLGEQFAAYADEFREVISNIAYISDSVSLSLDNITGNMRELSMSFNDVALASNHIAESIYDVNEKNEFILVEANRNAQGANNLLDLIKKFTT